MSQLSFAALSLSVVGGLRERQPEDGPSGHVAIDVRGAVQRVERTAKRATRGFGHHDGLLLLFRHEDGACSTFHQGVHHDLVREDVELTNEKICIFKCPGNVGDMFAIR